MSQELLEKQSAKKESILEHIRKAPIIQLACERAGIGRATFYRWRKDDSKFAEAVNDALTTGSDLINDMAESKLISAIKEQNLSAIVFWLKHHHPAYATKVQLDVNPHIPEELTPEQADVVRQALLLAGLSPEQDQINSLSQTHEQQSK